MSPAPMRPRSLHKFQSGCPEDGGSSTGGLAVRFPSCHVCLDRHELILSLLPPKATGRLKNRAHFQPEGPQSLPKTRRGRRTAQEDRVKDGDRQACPDGGGSGGTGSASVKRPGPRHSQPRTFFPSQVLLAAVPEPLNAAASMAQRQEEKPLHMQTLNGRTGAWLVLPEHEASSVRGPRGGGGGNSPWSSLGRGMQTAWDESSGKQP